MIHKFKRFFQVLLIALVFLTLAYPTVAIFSYHLIFKNKIYPNVQVGPVDISGKTKKQALEELTAVINNSNFQNINMAHQNNNWQISLEEIEFKYLPFKSVDKAYQFGRNGNYKESLVDKWQAWKKGIFLKIDYSINTNLLDEKIASIAAAIDKPSIPPTIELIDNIDKTIKIASGSAGKKTDLNLLKNVIDQQLSQLNLNVINLPVDIISKTLTEQQIEQTRQRAENLINNKIVLKHEEYQFTLNDKEIINFLGFENSFDKEKIASYTAELAKTVNSEPQNALFNFQANGEGESQGRVVEFKPAKNGYILSLKKTNDLLYDSLRALETEDTDTVNMSLPVDILEPEIATKDVNNLGIKELLGKGESWFRGSISSRIHNIKLAAQKFNGILLAPNETFSFNKTLGDVSPQTGFQQAYIIKDGRTVLGDGGGVCQVSTTLFRAALKAGMPIIERTAHAYRVSYYEQNYQVGVDATVYDPRPDLKIKNDTENYILIQTSTDVQNLKLTFDLYGTSDGRKVTISQTRIWDQVPPPPDLYQDDPSLPTGTIKQVDWKAWGAKAAFDWQVIRNKEVLQDNTFYSTYKPWQAVFLKGTGS